MSTDPDVIRADIERTRANLSDDVNALADEVNPKNVIRRKTQKVTGAFGSVRESVMGTATDAQDAAGGAIQARRRRGLERAGPGNPADPRQPTRRRSGRLRCRERWCPRSCRRRTPSDPRGRRQGQGRAADRGDQADRPGGRGRTSSSQRKSGRVGQADRERRGLHRQGRKPVRGPGGENRGAGELTGHSAASVDLPDSVP